MATRERVVAAPPVQAVPAPHAGLDRTVLLVGAAALGVTAAVLAAAAAWGGAAQAPVLSDPGALTRWGLLVTRAAYDLSAMATVGVLTVAVVLLPASGESLRPDAARLVRLSTRWSAAWMLAGVAGALLALSDATGMPVQDVLAPDVLGLALELPHTRALLSSAWLAGLVVVWSRWTRSPAGGWLVLLTAGAALLPTLLNAHGSDQASHGLGVTSLVVHVAAASVWLGGLLALALHLRGSGPSLAAALPRYSRAALACFVLVATTGVLTASTAFDRLAQVWTTPYGQLVLGKVVALAVLGALGHRHRRRSVRAVAAGRPRSFLVLAAVELVVMAATAGLAVGLSRTAPPASPDHGVATAEHAPQSGTSPA